MTRRHRGSMPSGLRHLQRSILISFLMAMAEADKSGYHKDCGIYSSNCPPAEIPSYPFVGFVTYMLERHLSRPEFSSQLVLVDATAGRSLTCRELLHALHSVAAGLDQIGVKQGNVVMLLLGNSLYVPVVIHAVMLIGAVVTTMNPLNTPREISRQVEDAKPNLIVTSWEFVHKVRGFGLPLVLLGDENAQVKSDSSLATAKVVPFSRLLSADPSLIPDVRIRQGDTAALLYSSGTTGLSKGVVLSHGNLIAAMAALDTMREEVMADDDIFLVLLPMFHVAGFVVLCCNALRGRPTFVILQKYDSVLLFETIQRYGVTRLTVAPPVVLDLLKPAASKYDLRSLTTLTCGAAPLGKDTIDAFLGRYPHVKHLVQGYGMTETTCVACTGYSPAGASGRLMSSFEAKVVDLESGRPVPPNHRGELWLRGPCVMQGYLNNPTATSGSVTREGWLRTGDLVSFDSNGFIYVVDRIKELIKYKGYQVAPAELEALLLNHPEISDCAVVPLADEQAGEIPLAYIVRAPGSNLTDTEVMDFIASQVAPYKRIRKVLFLLSIPKSPAGKILRKELVQLANSKL